LIDPYTHIELKKKESETMMLNSYFL